MTGRERNKKTIENKEYGEIARQRKKENETKREKR